MPRFIPPSVPVLRDVSPTGEDWIHEAKFDGWRMQIHKHDGIIKLYSRQGIDLAGRFPSLHDHLIYLPDSIIDAELVACDTDGKLDFLGIVRQDPNLCLWCFDLLALAAQDIRELPLVVRKEKLRRILIAVDDDRLRYSEEFSEPGKLLGVANRMGLEGVVSKRKDAPYRSGPTKDWVKVKCARWRDENRDRWEMFARRKKATA